MNKYEISLNEFVKNLHLDPVYKPPNIDEIVIFTPEVNRAGLVLTGFLDHHAPDRVQICGNAEMGYLSSLVTEKLEKAIRGLFETKPPVVVLTRGNEAYLEMIHFAKENGVPIFSTPESTSSFLADAISYLSVELAPRITRHGVLVEVYGEGILLLGESGIGKSETAIELVKRGHRLIADDAVELRRVSGKTIVGKSPENIRHYVELRGVGIINVRNIFGMGAVNISEKIDLVINLELWESGKTYSGIGINDQTIDILGVRLSSTTLPVKPGRNLAVIIEVAAMNHRNKVLGYNAEEELMEQLGLVSEPLDYIP